VRRFFGYFEDLGFGTKRGGGEGRKKQGREVGGERKDQTKK
jgi:hypothetical protein